MPSSPRQPGTLPPGEETEQGNPEMFLPESLIPGLLWCHTAPPSKISLLKFCENF